MFGSNDNDVKVRIDTTADRTGITQTESGLDSLERTGGRASSAMTALNNAAKLAAVAAGAAVAAAAVAAIKGAADLEQNLNVFKAVSSATNKEMQEVQKTSIALGKDLTLPGVSASDAAQAMVELGKAGLSVNDTLKASKGVLQLAKAGQLDTAAAAEVAANALQAFHLEGQEAARVADLLAAAANASSADVTDMAYALSQVSAVAYQTKRPVEDITAQIALLANNGIKGSDAGTSLKTMFSRLMAPTDKATGLMKDLGIAVYDAEGKLKSTRDIIEIFTKAMKNKTDAEKNAAYYTLFGSDAIRAASVVIDAGVGPYDKMTEAVNKQGAASQLAASYNSGLKGALDSLQSTIETIGLEIGVQFLPALTTASKWLSENLPAGIKFVTDSIKEWLKWMQPLFEYISSNTEANKTLVEGLKIAAIIIGVLALAIATGLVVAFATLQSIINVTQAVLNWFGDTAYKAGTAVGNMARTIKDAINGVPGAAETAFSRLADILTTPFKNAYNAIKSIINNISKAVGGGSIMGDLKIPGFVSGVRNFSGGLAVVGENGPELAYLPRGTNVYNNTETKQMMGSSGATFNNTYNIFNQVDLDLANREMAWKVAV